ncbi:MAG: protein GlxC, partial [Mesorhizobium sp.]
MPATNVSTAQRDQSHARVFDLAALSLRELNQALHQLTPGSNETAWE